MNTKIITWNEERGCEADELAEAAQIIRDGGLVAFPTETVYGLGGNGLDPQASQKIYAAKGRPSDNPLILHIAKIDQLHEVVSEIPEAAATLAEAFWPGPLTMIFKKADCVPYETTGGLDTVAVRMPQHMGALQFLEEAGVPVAAPSANTSGRPSPTLAKHVKEDLDGKIDMIIDGGEVGIGFESTIVDVTEEIPVILRPGFITQKMLQEIVGEVQMDPALMQVSGDQKPKAPGMKYRHYAPKADMTLYQGDTEDVIAHINREVAAYVENGTYRPEEIGILATTESADRYPMGQVVVAGSREEDTEGKYLYDALRRFDELHVKRILSETFFDSAKEEAVMNRLKKAAGQNLVQVESYEACNRVIFVSKDNITLGPMNEWILKSILMDKEKEVLSRGLVVLFEEPRNMKITDILINHGIPCEEQVSVAFSPEEVTRDTVIITMNFAEKVKVLEDYGLERNVYTLRELAGEEGDTEPPLGGDEEAYEASYTECKDLLYKIKKKLQWR